MQKSGEIENRVLLVSQTFPPASGIGGRRWAKFAKYLKKQGFQIEVISAELPPSSQQLWVNDVEGIEQYHYPHKYPDILSKNPGNILQKIQYRVAYTRAMLKADGTPYDRALYDEKVFLELLESRLKEFKPQTLIITSPPVNLVFYAAKIRNKYPEVKFIADFRDPWLDGDYYGYANLRLKALQAEEAKENFVVQHYDKILSPWPLVVGGFTTRYPDFTSKFELLSHGWDRDDILGKGKPEIELDMIYGGNLYKGFEPLLGFLARYAHEKNIKIEVYAGSEVPQQILNTQGNFRVRNSIPVQDFFARIRQSQQLLLLIPEVLKDGFPTKLLEFAATGKGIVAVGYAGTLSELIVKKGLGSFVALDRLEEDFENARKALSKLSPDRKWIKDHEINQITENLQRIIEELITAGAEE